MKIKLLLPCLFLLVYQISFAQSNADQLSNEFENLFSQMHENGQFNGTVLIAEKGKVLYKAAFGYGDYETKRKLEINSPCYLASVSKQFTAMGIMILKEKGKLSYDDPLTKYFPAFSDYAKAVTIRHMLHHTSGIANHYSLGAYKPGLSNNDVYQLLVKQENLDFSPGEQFSYSNGGYVLLAMIIEKVSGQPLPIFMKENIFSPLKMNNTLVFDKSTPEIKNKMVGYTQNWDLDDYEIYTTGAGGMYSTLEDLFKWDQALYNGKLVSKKTLEEAFTSGKTNNGEDTGYGFGWGISKSTEGGKMVNHSGGLNGFRTFIGRDLQHQRTFIVLTNNTNTYLGGMSKAVLDIFAGNEYELPKIRIGQKVHQLIDEVGVEKALEKYEYLKANHADEYDFNEQELNTLGYLFMGKKDYDTAIALFKQNVKSYPNGFNTYDSLAEAYMESSIANYKKSLELNAGNDNAVKMLEKMGVENKAEDIVIADEVLNSYIGKYELNPQFAIMVTKEGDQMKAQATNQPQFDIFPQAEDKFYLKVVQAQIQFNRNDSEEVESLMLFQGGQEMLFKKVE